MTKTTNNREADILQRLTRVEASTERIPKIEEKLDAFIQTADVKYLTREEANQRFTALDNKVKDNKNNLEKVIDVLVKVGPYVAIVIYIVIQKVI